MAGIVRMPEVATGAAEAAIAGWLIAVGDEVEAGQAIVEIETEKATIEFEAESAGVLAGILLEPGKAVAVGTPIAVLATGGQAPHEALAEAGVGEELATQESPAPAASADSAAPAAAVQAASESPMGYEPEGAGQTGRLFVSPLVRKLAKEHRLDLSEIRGSGPNGRIVRHDVEVLMQTEMPGAGAQAAVPTAESSTSNGSANAAPNRAAESHDFVDVPHTGMRRAIARRLTESKSTVPHFYLTADCRVDELLQLRARVNAESGLKISVNDFVVKAAAAALREVPAANAVWLDNATRRFDSVDISVAVAVPDGLLTPVLRSVERLSLGELSATIREFADRARNGLLKQHELEGGSFSVSNLGMYGTQEFSAIINPPQAGIFAVGAAQQQAVVSAAGELSVASVMRVTLSADHRVLDGAGAAELLSAFQRRVENPLSILV